MKEPILLHSCCAPCSSAILEWLLQNDYAPHVYYFNPNIFPEEEYLVRKNECIRYCEKLAVPFTDGDWDHAGWRNAVKGHECDPERGERCRLCFGVRMRATAAMAAKLGIEFKHDAADAPVKLTGALSIANIRPIEGVDAKVNTISKINGQYLIGSKYSFWALDESLKPVVSAAYDPWYSANVLDLVAITPYKDDAFILMGSNKSLLRARLNPNGDDVKNWGNFTAGRTQVEHVGGLGRARVGTERAKFSYVHSAASDGRYVYTATVPDNRNKKTFVISKALMSDWMLSGEFVPSADLKEGRTLGELYVTGMVYENGSLFAVSKNHNVLVEIDVAAEKVVNAWSIPAELTDVRGLVKTGDTFEVVDTNRIVTLKK